MALVVATGLHLGFHGRVLLEGADFAIGRGEKIGLVGPNGSGKTTLLRLLAGAREPERGKLLRMRGLRIGYLPQEPTTASDQALLDAVLAAAPRRAELEARIAAREEELAGASEPAAQMEIAGILAAEHEELAGLDRDFAPHHARRILVGLGFAVTDFARPLREFSGGWRVRAALAGLLFMRPDLLLLDEPTNHLDMPSVHWMNRFLDGWRQTLILVCHDREFLNRHVSRVLSFEPEGLRAYTGDYDAYRRQRDLELEQITARLRRDEQRRKELSAFVERFRAKATKARQAQSKARLIEKMTAEMPELPALRRTLKIRFPEVAPSSDPAIEVEGLGHAYGDHVVFAGVDLTVRRGDRVAIVGPNGAGKTTLLKLLAGELELRRGRVKLGANAQLRYFAQHHSEALDGAKTVLEEVAAAAPRLGQSEARGICGAFLFSGDDVDKQVAVLSGGEKTRVALARILAAPGNVLLLDEPTNHLDTESAERLAESLLEFSGTILFVSHNLAFARRLATRVFDVRDGSVFHYPGSLDDYLEHLARLADQRERDLAGQGDEASAAAGRRPVAAAAAAGASVAKQQRVALARERVRRQRDLEKLRRQLAEQEAQVAALEQAKAGLEERLADPAVYGDRAAAEHLADQHRQAGRALDAGLAAWEALVARLEEAEADAGG